MSGRAVGVVCSVLDRSGSALTFRPVVPSPTAMVTSLVEGVDGGLWMGTLDGLFHRLASGDVVPEPTAARAGVRNVRALALDDDGRLWVGHDEGLLVLGPGAAGSSSRHRHPASCAHAAPAPPANVDFDFRREATTRAP